MATMLTHSAIESTQLSSSLMNNDGIVDDPKQQEIHRLRTQVQDLFDANDTSMIAESNWVKLIPHIMVRMNTSNKSFRKSITGINLSPIPKTKFLPEIASHTKSLLDVPNQTEATPLSYLHQECLLEKTQLISDLPIDTTDECQSSTLVSQTILPPSKPVLPLPDSHLFCRKRMSLQVDQYESPGATPSDTPVDQQSTTQASPANPNPNPTTKSASNITIKSHTA